MLRRFLDRLRNLGRRTVAESRIPPPPFKASKRVARIMVPLWYGRISVEEAREMGVRFGMSEAGLEEMIAQATQPPSYWAREGEADDSA